MRNISDIVNTFKSDFDESKSFCDELYDNRFSKFFKSTDNLYSKFKDTTVELNSEDLSVILSQCPIDIIAASEELSDLRRNIDIVKLNIKELKSTGDSQSEIIENELLICLLESVLKRVEVQISYTRELIMSAKKLWDARSKTESAMPIDPVDDVPDLPDYSLNTKNSNYIKGV